MIPHRLLVEHHHNTLDAAHQASLKSLEAFAGLSEVWFNASRESILRSVGIGALAMDGGDFASAQTLLPKFESQLQVCGRIFHMMTSNYADLVAIAEDYWHRGQTQMQDGLHDLARHAPAGTEPVFTAAATTVQTASRVADSVVESTVEVAVRADKEINAGAVAMTEGGATTKRKARRPREA